VIRTLPLTLYRAATAALEPLAPWLLDRRAARGKEDAARVRERLGHAGLPRPDGPLVWLHGASVGETLSLLPLIGWLRMQRPDLTLLVTSGTATSADLLARRLPAGVIHQYAPIDAPGAVRRFLAHWRPGLVVLAEGEIWPNLIGQTKAAGAKLALVSARMTASSAAGWAKLPKSAKAVFGAFDAVLAQDGASARRLTVLGAGDDGRLNLKLAGEALPVDPAALKAIAAAAGKRPILLAASTHRGDEAMVLDAYAQADPDHRALLVIAPRHPARAQDVVDLARDEGFTAALQSETPFGRAEVQVIDTLGELGPWFAAAALAYVGGGLSDRIGGHNPLEAARLDCAVVSGPCVGNWASVYEALGDSAVTVRDVGDLFEAFKIALDDPASVKARARRARAVADRQAAGLKAAFAPLAALLP
jgi:3-deoxy-D-manno-octulosonic-acid transferase